MENEIRRFNTAHPRWRKEKKRPSMSYCRFFHSDELDAADDGTQGQFDFFQGEAHANAVARTHTESHEGVRVEIGLILRCPSVKRFLFNLDIPDPVLKTVLTGRGRTFRARGSIPRNNEEQRQGR